jgi:GTPase SAR1 family protein
MSIFQRNKQSMSGTPEWALKKIREAKENKSGYLDLSAPFDKSLTNLPEEVCELSELTALDLSRNKIRAGTDSIARLQNLTFLDLSGNQLSTLPESIARLQNLTTLDLSDNQLSTLPESITRLHSLTKLKLGGNKLRTLPESISQLQNLKELNLSDNVLSALPESISQLQYLTLLNLHNGKLSTLPESISLLQNLTWLNLSRNGLDTLPESLAQLQNLRSLDLSFNRLSVLPESILQLQNLISLDVGGNRLRVLPESISRLQNLISLDLSSLEGMEQGILTALPEAITQLPNLTNLMLGENPLVNPPIEVARRGVDAIRQYFRQLDQEGVDHLYEAKLLILGEGGAGKTTFAHKILDPNYALRAEESTKGVDVLRWSFRLEGVERSRQFQVNIWDFGGQEIYHATHQFFLTRRSLYVLVADTRKEDTDFYYWLNIAELLSDGSPLLIVKNEKQDRHREIPELQLKGEFKSLKEVVATNLATNRGLKEVKAEIEHYIQKLPHIGTPLPKTWVRVRGRLEKDPRNYISLEEYLSICRENGFVKMKDAMQLSGYLHDIGVFLHFQDDPLLKKTVILKPKWGTDAVYKVLDNKIVVRNLGRFTRADLEMIWEEPEYENVCDELLQLMMKFKLCYEIPTQKGTYIAPQLLTENQPDYLWDSQDNLLLRYSYEFMPKGILTQFIVAMHPYIWEQKNVWKSGVVIEKDRTRAEVIEYYGKREIRVRIAGPHGTDLMAIIRLELKQIHDTYPQLHYNELVPCNCSTCKDDQEPHFYRFEQLQKFVEKGILNVQCGRSGDMVNVRRLIKEGLNEDDPNAVRKTMSQDTVTRPGKAKRNGLFISYSHQDRDWLAKVQPHINVLGKMGITVNLWDDTQIKAGMKWKEEIEKALGSAKVAVLLVSTDFLNSDFISRDEVPALLKAAQEDGATILPLILKPCLYTSYPDLKDYQAVNDPSKPLSTLRKDKQEEIFVALSRRIIELMQSGG